MLLPNTKRLVAAQRDASARVARATKYSVDLPIVGRVMVPPPEQLAIYAALGGLAVLELIDWPVALAMGVGSALVSRHLSDLEAREDELAEAIEPTTDDTPRSATAGAPARKAAAKKVATPSAAKKAPQKTAQKTVRKAATKAPRKTPKKAPKKVAGKAPATAAGSSGPGSSAPADAAPEKTVQ
ncbi:MAG: hypothetical protein KDB45_05485 [Mycobacterium sp.]|nr:hypothetical protein [Mycobacterium sp.]